MKHWQKCAAILRDKGGRERAQPRYGIVLGSGLGDLVHAVEDATHVPYRDLPGFPVGNVAGHAQQVTLGALNGTPVALLAGRAHLYEGTDPAAIRIPVRTLHELGAEALILTNAAGSLDPETGPGQLMLISDHINLSGTNALVGPNDDEVGPRFFSMANAYDRDLREAMKQTAAALGVALAEGVYLAVSGPSFETPAEIRAFKNLGADAVGMSTVHETTVARHCGLKVAAISAITNLAEGLGDEELTHEGTLDAAAVAATDLQRLITEFVTR